MFFVALAAISASSTRRICKQFLSDRTLPLKMGTLLRLIISTCDEGGGYFCFRGQGGAENVYKRVGTEEKATCGPATDA